MRSNSLNAFWTKPVIIFVMLLLLLIPISFISSLTTDRVFVKHEAMQSILEPMGGELRIDGLLLSIPFKFLSEEFLNDGDKTKKIVSEKIDKIVITPQFYSVKTQINPYNLKRGIFSVPVFDADIKIHANFKVDASYLNINESSILWDEAVLILGGANKSFTAFPSLKIDGKELEQSYINPQSSPFSHNIYFKIPSDILKKEFEIDGNLSVQGGEKLYFTPLAKDNTFEIKSSWSSPSFSGGWLPKERDVRQDGFDASYKIAGLSTNFAPAWIASQQPYDPKFESVNIGFIEPVNNYSLMKRCITYAILFIAVPFLAIFICEIYSRVRIHPVQYLLIGVADVLFYLLTLSFSEHISFFMSYLIATIVVCLAVLLYAAAIFRGKKWGVFIAAVQLVSYCLLYGILQSQDYALLLGSVMIFAVIAMLMYLTRKIDWYENGANLK